MKRKWRFFLLCFAVLVMLGSSAAFADDGQCPRIVDTVYRTGDIVVADIVLTEAPYCADSSGKEDCTEALQRAINECHDNGGGTVFLPAGSYRLSGSIHILPFVTVMGDRQDPDNGNDYGTLIIADVPESEALTPALFTVGGSAGAVELTVWYPEQSLNNVRPYPYTFYVTGHGSDYMLQTIKNCTLLNSYRGIGAGTEDALNGIIMAAHEQLNIENVKGTFLREGMSVYNSADVDTVKGFYVSGKYWADAGDSFNAPDKSELDRYTETHCTGMTLGDLEWPEYADVRIEHCEYGIHLVPGMRAAFAGTMTGLSITDCRYGIYAEHGAVQSGRGVQWGIGICDGVIEGSELAVYDMDSSVMMLADVKVTGKVKANNYHIDNKAVFASGAIDYDRQHKKPAAILYTVTADRSGLTDSSVAVQEALDKAAKTGGVVYLPGGIYRFEHPVTVPAGVELRGASSVPARDQSGDSGGTMILAYCGYEDEYPMPKALISLNGDHAGISGIRINFVRNSPHDDSGRYLKTTPAVYASGRGCYAENCGVILASTGFVFQNCTEGLLRHNVGCAYEQMFRLENSNDVFLEGNLQNATTIVRNGYAGTGHPDLQGWLSEADIFRCIFIPITREGCDYITLESCDDITVFNTFIYGGRRFLLSDKSSVLTVNTGCDGSSKQYYSMSFSKGGAAVANHMRSTFDGADNARSYELSGHTKLRICNRISVDIVLFEKNETRNTTWLMIMTDDIHELTDSISQRIMHLWSDIFDFFKKIGKGFYELC